MPAAVLIVVMSLGGLLNGMIQPSRDMMVRAVTPPGSFGKVFGFVTTGFNLGGMVAPLLYAWLMDHGQPRMIFMIVVAFILLALVTAITRAQTEGPSTMDSLAPGSTKTDAERAGAGPPLWRRPAARRAVERDHRHACSITARCAVSCRIRCRPARWRPWSRRRNRPPPAPTCSSGRQSRSRDPAKRKILAEIAGDQKHIEQCPLYIAWVADLSRNERLGEAEKTNLESVPWLETFMVACIDAALAAQNAVVAAQSIGLRTVYIGAMRNDPVRVAELFGLPPRAFVVFGLCVGYADPKAKNEVKPRLPQSIVLHHDGYDPACRDPRSPGLRRRNEQILHPPRAAGRDLDPAGAEPHGPAEIDERPRADARRAGQAGLRDPLKLPAPARATPLVAKACCRPVSGGNY